MKELRSLMWLLKQQQPGRSETEIISAILAAGLQLAPQGSVAKEASDTLRNLGDGEPAPEAYVLVSAIMKQIKINGKPQIDRPSSIA